MIENKWCPLCGKEITFSYMRPDYYFDIVKGKIERDTNNDLWEGKDPYFKFHCSNDREHNIDDHSNPQDEIEFILWTETVEKEFYEKIFPEL